VKYQLVIQIRGDSLSDYDEMVELEDELITELGDSAEVDGHDVGSGETNIFILTNDPLTSLRHSLPLLERRRALVNVRAAYRLVEGERYTVVWPEGSTEDFRIV